MSLIFKLGSLFDEKTWGLDSAVRGSSLYKVSSSNVSLGKIDGSWDNDYYALDGLLSAGSSYEVHLTSDTINHGWSSYTQSTNLEFDLYDYYGTLLGSSQVDYSRSMYDDTLTFTVPSNYASWQPYYIDVHGLVFGATDYAVTLNLATSTGSNSNSPAVFSNASYTGSLTVGSQVTSSITYYDADGYSSVTQVAGLLTGWYTQDSSGYLEYLGGDYVDSITLTQDMVGKTLLFNKGFTDALNNLETSDRYTVGVVQSNNSAPTGSVTISGTAQKGQLLTAVTNTIADADGLGTFSYQWLRDGSSISGATSSTYTLTNSDIGSSISVRVSYTDGNGANEAITSTGISVSDSGGGSTSQVDVEGPILTSFSIRDTTLEVGETVYIDYLFADASPLDRVYFSFTDENGNWHSAEDKSWVEGIDGTAELEITSGMLSGSYSIYSVDAYDQSFLQNHSTYYENPAISSTNAVTHSLDLSTLNFTVAGRDSETAESIGAISAINAGSGSDVVLNFYADSDVVGASVNSFDAVVRFDTTGAEYASAEFGDYLGFANSSEDTIILNGISVNGISSSDPLFTLKFKDLDLAADFSVYVSDVIVNGSSLSGSTLVIGGPDTVDVSTTVVTRSGAKMSDVSVSFNDGNETTSVSTAADGIGTKPIAIGSNLQITGSLDYDPSLKSINSQDALDALRLGVGMDTQNGTNTAFDYIAADFNQDGKVSSQDALAILKYAVGLPTSEQAEWIFVDSNGDYSDISRTNTNYAEGISTSGLASATELSLTGILIGDVNDSYSGLVALPTEPTTVVPVGSVSNNANVDTVAPVLNSLSLSNTSLSPGQTLYITADVYDISGLSPYNSYIMYKSESGHTFSSHDTDGDGVYALEIKSDMPSGLYTIDHMRFMDDTSLLNTTMVYSYDVGTAYDFVVA